MRTARPMSQAQNITGVGPWRLEELLPLGQDVIERVGPKTPALSVGDLGSHLLHELLPRLVDLFLEVLRQRAALER